MTHIEYSGIAPESIKLVNSKKFRAVLKAHPNLKLVTVEEDDEGDEVFNEVTLPLPEEHDACVAVMDRDDEDAFMWVLYDDSDSIADPSPAFIEILKVMDRFSVKILDARLFAVKGYEDLYMDSPEILEATFDFTKGEYIL